MASSNLMLLYTVLCYAMPSLEVNRNSHFQILLPVTGNIQTTNSIHEICGCHVISDMSEFDPSTFHNGSRNRKPIRSYTVPQLWIPAISPPQILLVIPPSLKTGAAEGHQRPYRISRRRESVPSKI
jgi:hypothetical protein